MAREFSKEAARNLINRYSAFVRNMEEYNSRFTVIKQRVSDEASAVMASKVVSNLVQDQVKTGNLNVMPQPNEKALIQAALNYNFVASSVERIQRLYRECQNLNTTKLRQLNDATSPLKWLFSSSDSKRNMIAAYNELLLAADDYEKAIMEAEVAFSKIDSVTTDVAYARISDQKADIVHAIRNCYQDYDKAAEGMESVRLAQRYMDAVRRYGELKEIRDRKLKELRDHSIRAAKRAVDEQAIKDLQTYEVEALTQVRNGIRVKALRDSGYDTVAKVYAAPLYAISSIYGISMESAGIIKDAAEEIARRVQKTSKLQISSDDRTLHVTALLSYLFVYSRLRIYCGTTESKIESIKKGNPQVPSTLPAIPNNIQWIFMDNSLKKYIHETYKVLERVTGSGFVETVDTYQRALNQSISPNPDMVWSDFEKDSFAYFNLLEELVPGVLGNNDSRYGLPEDLARQIQDQTYFPNGLKVSLRRYQEWGVKYILHQGRALLGDEMGLGKTVQAIATMVSLRNTGATHFMVVCPASVLPNWNKEVSTKSHLTAISVYGSYRAYALQEWIGKGGVAITTYETLKNITFQQGFQFNLLVVDEAHFVKNESAARSQNVRRISMYAKRLLFMTGTALENKVDEMLSLINVLQPAIANKARNIAFMSQAPQFRQTVAPVYYRRKREDVLTELPAITEVKEWCVLLPQEREIYRSAVMSKDRTQIRRVSWNAQDLGQSSKALRLKELVEEAGEDGRKVLVFSFYLETIQRVMQVLGGRCTQPINGAVSADRRQEIIDQFEKMPAGSVLPAQIMAGGTGLNIQAASVVIICEPQLKPSIENQAIARAYRMGQTRKVLVYRLLADDTIDERIDEMLSEKQAIFDAFADVSAAAAATQKEEQQIDDKTFGKLIQEEIDRINAENGNIQDISKASSSMDASDKTQRSATRKTEPVALPQPKAPGRMNSLDDSLQGQDQDRHSRNLSEKENKSTIPTDKQAPSSLYHSESDESRITDMKIPVSAEQEAPTVVMHRFNSLEDLLLLIHSLNVETKDNRPKGGSLWIQSNPAVDLILKDAVVLNADEIEIYPKRASSCKAFSGAPGWYIY